MGIVSFLGIVGFVGTAIFLAKELNGRGSRSCRPGSVSQTPTTPQMAYGEDRADMVNRNLHNIVAEHTDYTAEILSLGVYGETRAAKMKELKPGDYVELRYKNGEVAVYNDDMFMGTLLCPDNSHVPALLKSNCYVDAYLGGRDLAQFYSDNDFCSIIAFYKIPGVPPTKVNLEF